MKLTTQLIALLGLVPGGLTARADVKLHGVFTDHMVLQRDINVSVWGWAAPGEKVSVQFGGQDLSALSLARLKLWKRIVPDVKAIDDSPAVGFYFARKVQKETGDPKNIHPRNKRDVGERLALWALAKDYGKTDLVYSSPLYASLQIEDGNIRITFDGIGSGLMVGKKTVAFSEARMKYLDAYRQIFIVYLRLRGNAPDLTTLIDQLPSAAAAK